MSQIDNPTAADRIWCINNGFEFRYYRAPASLAKGLEWLSANDILTEYHIGGSTTPARDLQGLIAGYLAANDFTTLPPSLIPGFDTRSTAQQDAAVKQWDADVKAWHEATRKPLSPSSAEPAASNHHHRPTTTNRSERESLMSTIGHATTEQVDVETSQRERPSLLAFIQKMLPDGSSGQKLVARLYLRVHRAEVKAHFIERGRNGAWPNHAVTRAGIIGHRGLLMEQVTFCGRVASETSTGVIPTLLGWNCGCCRRVARKVGVASHGWELTHERPSLF